MDMQTQATPTINPGIQLNKSAQKVLEDVDLLYGEQIQYLIQADGYFIGSNPIAKAIAKIQSKLIVLTGGYVRIFLFVTNQRVILAQAIQAFCGWQRNKGVNAIALASIQEAGWAKETQMCCIHTRSVHMQSKTQTYNFVITKLKDEGLRDFVSNISAVMLANVEGRTAT